MRPMKKPTARRIEKIVEIVTFLGLAAVTGGVADAATDGTRMALDLYAVSAGVILLALAVWLTGFVPGDTV